MPQSFISKYERKFYKVFNVILPGVRHYRFQLQLSAIQIFEFYCKFRKFKILKLSLWYYTVYIINIVESARKLKIGLEQRLRFHFWLELVIRSRFLLENIRQPVYTSSIALLPPCFIDFVQFWNVWRLYLCSFQFIIEYLVILFFSLIIKITPKVWTQHSY